MALDYDEKREDFDLSKELNFYIRLGGKLLFEGNRITHKFSYGIQGSCRLIILHVINIILLQAIFRRASAQLNEYS